MSVIYWPANLKPLDVTLGEAGRAVSGGRTLSGVERLTQSDAGFWRMSLTFQLRKSAHILTWRAVLAQLGGRAGRIIVPAFDCARSPGATDFRLPALSVPHSDGAPFSDGSHYLGRAYNVSFAAALPARATAGVLVLHDTPHAAPWPGMYFSVGDRLHIVRTAGPVSGGQCAITFSPPLRAPAGPASVIRFDGARGTFRLAEDEGGIATLARLQAADLTVNFVEAV
ncbi:MAG: hypothetical protein LCH38_10775 [Proteobacteria bacterium]|nr:hypothetical protein [Pseudomonadota bacterium]